MAKFSLEGKGTASDAEIIRAAKDIFNILMTFDSPKDAAPAFLYAHIVMMQAAFPPERRKEAFDAIDIHVKLLKEELNKGWH